MSSAEGLFARAVRASRQASRSPISPWSRRWLSRTPKSSSPSSASSKAASPSSSSPTSEEGLLARQAHAKRRAGLQENFLEWRKKKGYTPVGNRLHGWKSVDADWRHYVSVQGGLNNVPFLSFKERAYELQRAISKRSDNVVGTEKRIFASLERVYRANPSKNAQNHQCYNNGLKVTCIHSPEKAAEWLRWRIENDRAVHPSMFGAALEGIALAEELPNDRDKNGKMIPRKWPAFPAGDLYGYDFGNREKSFRSRRKFHAIVDVLNLMKVSGDLHPALKECSVSGPTAIDWIPVLRLLSREKNITMYELALFYQNAMGDSADARCLRAMLHAFERLMRSELSRVEFCVRIMEKPEFQEQPLSSPHIVYACYLKVLDVLSNWNAHGSAHTKHKSQLLLTLHRLIKQDKNLPVLFRGEHSHVENVMSHSANDFSNYKSRLLQLLINGFTSIRPAKQLHGGARMLYKDAATALLTDPNFEMDSEQAVELLKSLAKNPGPVVHLLPEVGQWIQHNNEIDHEDLSIYFAFLEFAKASAQNLGIQVNVAEIREFDEGMVGLQYDIKNLVDYTQNAVERAEQIANAIENEEKRNENILNLRLALIEILHLTGSWESTILIIKNSEALIWKNSRLYNSILAFHARFSGDIEATERVIARMRQEEIPIDETTLKNYVACYLGEHDMFYIGEDGTDLGAPADIVQEAVEKTASMCRVDMVRPSASLLQRLAFNCKRLNLKDEFNTIASLARENGVKFYQEFRSLDKQESSSRRRKGGKTSKEDHGEHHS